MLLETVCALVYASRIVIVLRDLIELYPNFIY